MYTLLAHHGTAAHPPMSSDFGACFTKAVSMGGSSAYDGDLGVLRHERPNLERQRRYDFWLRRA